MKDLTWKNGEFCWVDLMTTDLTAAKKFYTAVFNWSYSEASTPNNGSYFCSKIPEGNVGGLGGLSEELQKKNIPSHWTPYVLVENADEAVKRAKKLGGKIITEPFGVIDYGRMASVAGPSGASLCVWETKKVDEELLPRTWGMNNGMYGWVELNTHDLDNDGRFFCNLFNWTPKKSDLDDGRTYIEFRVDNSKIPAGGMLEIQKEWGDVPSCWTIYFTVKNMDKSISVIEKAGGEVVLKPFEVKGVGLMGVAKDPTGAHFCLAEWRMQK